MTNSADPDQLASSEAILSGSKLFAKAGYIPVSGTRDNTTAGIQLLAKQPCIQTKIYGHFSV